MRFQGTLTFEDGDELEFANAELSSSGFRFDARVRWTGDVNSPFTLYRCLAAPTADGTFEAWHVGLGERAAGHKRCDIIFTRLASVDEAKKLEVVGAWKVDGGISYSFGGALQSTTAVRIWR